MLRGENVGCGTSTTGTGTLTCAAPPSGFVDLYTYLTASGVNFVNGNAVLMPLTIIEYTDGTFATPSKSEDGIYTVTLGASLTATTIARTTILQTSTSGSNYSEQAPSAISIGTAANTLIFVAPSAVTVPTFDPYVETAGSDGFGVLFPVNNSSGTRGTLTSGTEIYMPFEMPCALLVKRATLRVATAYATGSPVSNIYFRLYARGTNARPGKLLLDLGLVGTANVSLNSTGTIQTALATTGFMLKPGGSYYASIVPIFSGGSTTPVLTANGGPLPQKQDSSGSFPNGFTTATSGSTPAPDPANTTGYSANPFQMFAGPQFWLKAS